MTIKDIKKMQVPDGKPNHPGRPLRRISQITMHETGNRDPGATAEAHARYQAAGGGGKAASWHYTVDGKEIWQSFGDGQACWHTGTAEGNETSIGVEICVNSREGFRRACENAAALCRILMERHGLGPESIVQHHKWSGKNCPENLRSGAWGINWPEFLALISGANARPETETRPPANIPALDAMEGAGAQFDRIYWAEVLTGGRQTSQENFQELIRRAAVLKWPISAPKINAVLDAIMGTD